MYICCLSFGRAQENLRNGGVHMLPNFWSRTGKIEEGDVSISYLDFGQVQEKLRKGGVHMMPNIWSRTGNIEEGG